MEPVDRHFFKTTHAVCNCKKLFHLIILRVIFLVSMLAQTLHVILRKLEPCTCIIKVFVTKCIYT